MATKALVIDAGTTKRVPDAETLVVGAGIDAATAGALTIGGTTATSITLGSPTIPVTIPGDVTTVGGTTFTTDATFEGNVTFGAGAADTVTFAPLTTVTSDIALGGGSPTYKITNLANGTNPNDAVNFAQLSAIASGVSSVTASAPLASSGGATPNISLTGTVPVANGGTGTSTAFTPGSVVFAGASGVYSQDNANFFWDDTNNHLGIGTTTPAGPIDALGNLTATYIARVTNTSAGLNAISQLRAASNTPLCFANVSAFGSGNGLFQFSYSANSAVMFAADQGASRMFVAAQGTTTPILIGTGSNTAGGVGIEIAANHGNVTVNPDGDAGIDFIVEGDTNPNLIFVDASADHVGIGTSNVSAHLFNIGSGASSNFAIASGGRIHTYGGAAPTDGQILIGDTVDGRFEAATITAGTGISVTNGAGSITIAATGGTDYSVVTLTTAQAANTAVTVAGAAAIATAASTSRVAGIVTATNTVKVLGIVTCDVEGALSIAAGDAVYLSASEAGAVTNVAPSTATQVVAELGIATAASSGGTVAVLWQPKSIVVL
jgi:hypothetical protein